MKKDGAEFSLSLQTDGRKTDLYRLINGMVGEKLPYNVSFVSFENECILIIYDSRGCDIVFADGKKLNELYPLLKRYEIRLI